MEFAGIQTNLTRRKGMVRTLHRELGSGSFTNYAMVSYLNLYGSNTLITHRPKLTPSGFVLVFSTSRQDNLIIINRRAPISKSA